LKKDNVVDVDVIACRGPSSQL